MPKRAKSPQPRAAAITKAHAQQKEEAPANPGMHVIVSHERKWWETWWGTSILLTSTGIIAGLIVWRVNERFGKSASPSDYPSANTSSETQVPQLKPAPADPSQEAHPRRPETGDQPPQEKPVDRNVIRPSDAKPRPLVSQTRKDRDSDGRRALAAPDYLARNNPPLRPGGSGHTTAPGRTTTTAGKPGTGTAGKPGTTSAGKPGVGAGGKTAAAPASGKPGAPGKATGAMSRTAANRTPPGRQVSLKGGGSAHIRPNGQIRSVNRNGMHIEHNLHGGRKIESTRNGAKVVTTGKHSGYVQRAYVTRNGRSYVSRTTVVNGTTYSSVYSSYSYGGYCCYYGYYPAYYYHPAFYRWAYSPWQAPVAYDWGWNSAPWFAAYREYFAPYAVYPSAAFWLTDYLIAADLRVAYAEDQIEKPSANNGSAESTLGSPPPAASPIAPTLNPGIKQAIIEEVKTQLAAEQAEITERELPGGDQKNVSGYDEAPPALNRMWHTFIVNGDFTVVADGQECALTQGDVITRISDTPDEERKVTVSVSSSKKEDCAAGKQVAVAVEDLQEMHNHFQQQIDEGLKTLAAKQGKDGLPESPDTSTVASDVPPPPTDTTAAKALQDQQAAADRPSRKSSKKLD